MTAQGWYTYDMEKKRKRKVRAADENVAARRIIHTVTERQKNPAAVALGKLGGLKGGAARARALSPDRRREIAAAAARARWSRVE